MSTSGFLRVSWFIKSVISFTVTQHQQWLSEPSRGYIIKTLSIEPQCCLFLREDDLKFRWATLFMRHQSKLTFHRIIIVIWEELLTSAPSLVSVFRFLKKSDPWRESSANHMAPRLVLIGCSTQLVEAGEILTQWWIFQHCSANKRTTEGGCKRSVDVLPEVIKKVTCSAAGRCPHRNT